MRKLFLTLAKLMGLLLIYRALVNFMQIGFAIGMLIRSEPTQIEQVAAGLVGLTLYVALSLAMAWVLLMKTDWLANKLRVEEDGTSLRLPDRSVLVTGTQLIGLFVLVNAIPSLARALLEARGIWREQVSVHVWSKIIPAALQAALGLWFAMRPSRVVDIIESKNKQTAQAVPPDAGSSP